MVKMTSAKEELYLKVLLCGTNGTGKTYLAAQFPNPFFINVDRGLRTLTKKEIPYVILESPSKRDKVTPALQVLGILRQFRDNEGPIIAELKAIGYVPKTIVLDSLTALSSLLEVDWLLNPQGKPRDQYETLELQDYNLIKRRMESVMRFGRDELPFHFVATATLDYTPNELGRVLESPRATGNKLGQGLPDFFDECYLMEKETNQEKDKNVFFANLLGSSRFKFARTRSGADPVRIKDPSWEKLSTYYGL